MWDHASHVSSPQTCHTECQVLAWLIHWKLFAARRPMKCVSNTACLLVFCGQPDEQSDYCGPPRRTATTFTLSRARLLRNTGLRILHQKPSCVEAVLLGAKEGNPYTRKHSGGCRSQVLCRRTARPICDALLLAH